MVLTILDTLGPEETIQVLAVVVLISPLTDGVEHIALDFNALLASCGVVECTEDVVADIVNRYTRVLPCIQDTTGKIISKDSILSA